MIEDMEFLMLEGYQAKWMVQAICVVELVLKGTATEKDFAEYQKCKAEFKEANELYTKHCEEIAAERKRGATK